MQSFVRICRPIFSSLLAGGLAHACSLTCARTHSIDPSKKKTQTGNNVLISHAYLPLDSTGRGASRILIPEVKRFGARDIKVGLLARTTEATLRALSP
jgi:hypothetical protein